VNAHWPMRRLDDIFEIARGGSPRPIESFLTDDPTGLNWIKIGDATASEKFIKSTKEKIKLEGLYKSRFVSSGDFLLTNSMSFGRPYIMATDGCIHDGWLVLKPRDRKLVDQDFFYHLLGSNMIYDRLAARASGSTVKNLNTEIVSGIEIGVPPLNEQKRIAAILDRADSIRLQRRRSLELLDSLTQSIFLTMFAEEIGNRDSTAFWTISEISTLQNGAYFPADRYSQTGEGVEMVHMSDAFYGTLKRGGLRRVNCKPSDIEHYQLLDTDLLVARRSLNIEGAAKPCLIPKSREPLIFESSFIRLRLDPALVRATYMFHYLSNGYVRDVYLKPYITQSTISGINQSNLGKVQVLVPSLSRQDEFMNVARRVDEERISMELSLQQHENLFASFQSRAFSGQL
jgi:type I restriction enzyme, S subunit